MKELLIATAQVSAILLVALVLAWLLRRQAASLRHAVLTMAMACAAVVPLLGAILPSWSLPVMPPAAAGDSLLASQVPAPAHEAPAAPRGVATGQPPSAGDSASAVAPVDVSQAVEGQTVAPPVPQRTSAVNLPQIAVLAWRVYLCGLALSLALLAAGVLRVCWIAMRAAPMRTAPWQRQAQAVALAHGLRRHVRLKQCAHTPLLATWGWMRPEVLLPPGAQDWPEERIEAVLLHELAHVRRNDWLILLFAGVLRAVYWFNPLVWIACRRLRQEAEQACDDAVLGQGVDATDYAAQLLALARECARPARLLAAAPSMARPSTLRRRVAGILDPATSRARPAIPTVAGLTVVMLAVTGIVAACDVANRPALPQAATTPTAPAMVETTGSSAELPEPLPSSDLPPSPEPAVQAAAAAYVLPAVPSAPASPQQVVAGILELVRSALADESTAVLDEIAYPITGLNHVQRYALAVVDDDGRDPATLAANCVEIINALVNTGNLAANATRRPRGAQLSPAIFDPLAAALRAKAAELSEVLMPVSATATPVASTPVHRAAADVLDLAQATLRDVSFVGPRQGSWLVTELDTLARAASSVIHDPGRDVGAPNLQLHALQSSLRSAARQANQIAARPDRAAPIRDKAIALAASLQGAASRLDAAVAQPAVSPSDPLASVLARVTTEVHGLRLATLLRIDDMFVATLGRESAASLNVVIEEARTEGEAMQKEERSVFSTPATGFVQERNGMRVHTWGGEEDASGYRVLTRIGKRVVNVSAPPELSGFVLPVLDGIAGQLR